MRLARQNTHRALIIVFSLGVLSIFASAQNQNIVIERYAIFVFQQNNINNLRWWEIQRDTEPDGFEILRVFEGYNKNSTNPRDPFETVCRQRQRDAQMNTVRFSSSQTNDETIIKSQINSNVMPRLNAADAIRNLMFPACNERFNDGEPCTQAITPQQQQEIVAFSRGNPIGQIDIEDMNASPSKSDDLSIRIIVRGMVIHIRYQRTTQPDRQAPIQQELQCGNTALKIHLEPTDDVYDRYRQERELHYRTQLDPQATQDKYSAMLEQQDFVPDGTPLQMGSSATWSNPNTCDVEVRYQRPQHITGTGFAGEVIVTTRRPAPGPLQPAQSNQQNAFAPAGPIGFCRQTYRYNAASPGAVLTDIFTDRRNLEGMEFIDFLSLYPEQVDYQGAFLTLQVNDRTPPGRYYILLDARETNICESREFVEVSCSSH